MPFIAIASPQSGHGFTCVTFYTRLLFLSITGCGRVSVVMRTGNSYGRNEHKQSLKVSSLVLLSKGICFSYMLYSFVSAKRYLRSVFVQVSNCLCRCKSMRVSVRGVKILDYGGALIFTPLLCSCTFCYYWWWNKEQPITETCIIVHPYVEFQWLPAFFIFLLRLWTTVENRATFEICCIWKE